MSHSWPAAAALCLYAACFSSSANAQWLTAVYDDAYSKAAHTREQHINAARRRYDEASAPLLKAIADAEGEANRIFDETARMARAQYNERVLPAKTARDEALRNARDEHHKAMRASKSRYDQVKIRADEIKKRAKVEGRTTVDRAHANLRARYVSLRNDVRTLEHAADAAQVRARSDFLREINQNSIPLQREIDQVHARVEDARKMAIESFLDSLNEETVALQRIAASIRMDADKVREEAVAQSLTRSRAGRVPRTKAEARAAEDGRRAKRKFLEMENAKQTFDALSGYKNICRLERDGTCGAYRDLTTKGKALARSEAEVAEQRILAIPEAKTLFATLEGFSDLCRLREDGTCVSHRNLTAKGKAQVHEEMAKVRQETLGTEAAKKAITLLEEAQLLCEPGCAEVTKMGRQFLTATRLDAEKEVWNEAAGANINYEDLVGSAKSKFSEERMRARLSLDEEERRANHRFDAIERPRRISRDKALEEASLARELGIEKTTAPYKRALDDAAKEREQAIARADREFHEVVQGIRTGKWFAMLWYVYIGD